MEKIGHLSAANGVLYNRQLTLFYADHDMKAEEAYASAVKEYEVWRDIYGADAVAWTALKAGGGLVPGVARAESQSSFITLR